MSAIIEYANKIFVDKNGPHDDALIAVLTLWAAYHKIETYKDERVPAWAADVFCDIGSFQQSCQYNAEACAKGLILKRQGIYGAAHMTAEQCSQRYNKAYRNAKALELLPKEFNIKILFSPPVAVEPGEMPWWVEKYWGGSAAEEYQKAIHNAPRGPMAHMELEATGMNIGNILRLLRILRKVANGKYWDVRITPARK